uniref:Uncharacterized protein n=1 Tax=Timema tahoe TaxID=61484 RepID=A0A7R9IU26_9NEOP|nr:unnamed protein product [Timema tahoe]
MSVWGRLSESLDVSWISIPLFNPLSYYRLQET